MTFWGQQHLGWENYIQGKNHNIKKGSTVFRKRAQHSGGEQHSEGEQNWGSTTFRRAT